MRTLLAAAVMILLVSCEIDYDLGGETGTEEKVPDIVMKGVRQIEVQGDQFFRVEAETTEVYYDSGETRYRDLRFEEQDRDEKPLRRGSAEEMVQYENDDLFMKGHIDIEDLEENSSIQGEEFSWNSEERRLDGSENGRVILIWDGENRLEGEGFSADFQNSEIRFSRSVNGVIEGSP